MIKDLIFRCKKCRTLNEVLNAKDNLVKCEKCGLVHDLNDLFGEKMIKEKVITTEIFTIDGNCLKIIERERRW